MKKLLINIEKKNIRYDDFLIEESKESIEFNSKKNQKEESQLSKSKFIKSINSITDIK